MTEKAKKIKAMYDLEIFNLKWHLETNGNIISDEEKKRINNLIRDRQDFISHLKVL